MKITGIDTLCLSRPHEIDRQWEILTTRPAIKDGWLELPDRPGPGVDIAESLEQRFPYIEGAYAIAVER